MNRIAAFVLLVSVAAEAGAAGNLPVYREAMGALYNFGSCGVRAGPGEYAALETRLHAAEEAATRRGLGERLAAEREDYRRWLSIALLRGCGGGRVVARNNAHAGIEAFERWVVAQPGG